MYGRILGRMRELVRTSQYVMTSHGFEEMQTDRLTVFDVEETLGGQDAVTVAKISPADRLVVITVYLV